MKRVLYNNYVHAHCINKLVKSAATKKLLWMGADHYWTGMLTLRVRLSLCTTALICSAPNASTGLAGCQATNLEHRIQTVNDS